jgi:hypothetical protein
MRLAINAFVLFTIVFSGGCARVVYKSEKASASGFTMKVSGFSMSPETAIGAMAEAEVRQSEAHAIRQCANDPKKCWTWGLGGGLDIPAGYTVAGMQAVGAQQAAGAQQPTAVAGNPVDIGGRLDKIMREIGVVKGGLKEFFCQRGKKSKCAKRR